MIFFKMRLCHLVTVILLAAILGLACPPFDLNANATGTRLQYRDSSLSVYLPSGRSQWPTSREHITHICYCWSDQESAEYLEEDVDAAIKMLISQLGGPASASSGHSLQFQPFKIGPNEHFCWDDFEKKKWNPLVPRDCVAITEVSDGASEGTLGRSNGPYNDDQIQLNNYNYMNISEDSDMGTILHEFGHVLGFAHEHQRSDRHEYIYFNCEAVEGYDEMKKLADSQIPKWNMDTLCSRTDATTNNKRKKVHEFWRSINNLKEEPGMPMWEFDFLSIMIYGSSEGSKDVAKCELLKNKDWCPLMRYRSPETSRGPTAPMVYYDVAPDYHRFLSHSDVVAFKKYYPWS